MDDPQMRKGREESFVESVRWYVQHDLRSVSSVELIAMNVTFVGCASAVSSPRELHCHASRSPNPVLLMRSSDLVALNHRQQRDDGRLFLACAT